MATAKLYIAIYRPVRGNYKHWALYLDSASEDVIYEVIGDHPRFERHHILARPDSSMRHQKDILVGTINERDIPQLKQIVAETPVDNDTVYWNCQDYVIDILQRLKNECVIDEDDRDYEKGLKLATDRHFGPM